MKRLACTFLSFSVLAAIGQNKVYETRNEAAATIKGGVYKSACGWEIKEGQDIKLGHGSMPDKTFAFITEIPNLLTYNEYTDYNKKKLPHVFNGRQGELRDFAVAGTKKTGFWIVARLKVGGVSRYSIDVENAIEANELEVPVEYAKTAKTEPATSAKPDITDQIKKLKELKDAGALTQEQYDAAVKKVLEN